MNATAKQKMITSTALLLREYGLSGTSVRDVVEHSGAPRGSVYHHFPGGKTQMVEEAVGWAGDSATQAINLMAEQQDPIGAARGFLDVWRHVLVATDFRAGCPVLAVAAEAQDDGAENKRLARATARVFRDWTDALATNLQAAGVPSARSSSIATMIVASIEGAVVMCRAGRTTEPLDAVGDELRLLIEAVI